MKMIIKYYKNNKLRSKINILLINRKLDSNKQKMKIIVKRKNLIKKMMIQKNMKQNRKNLKNKSTHMMIKKKQKMMALNINLKMMKMKKKKISILKANLKNYKKWK